MNKPKLASFMDKANPFFGVRRPHDSLPLPFPDDAVDRGAGSFGFPKELSNGLTAASPVPRHTASITQDSAHFSIADKVQFAKEQKF